jgi:hypothetical protein
MIEIGDVVRVKTQGSGHTYIGVIKMTQPLMLNTRSRFFFDPRHTPNVTLVIHRDKDEFEVLSDEEAMLWKLENL